jgi:hypothetical protein
VAFRGGRGCEARLHCERVRYIKTSPCYRNDKFFADNG